MRGRLPIECLLLAAMACTACANAGPADRLQPKTERAEDAARSVTRGDGVVIEITSPTGIGRMTIPAPARGAWPEPLSLRLRHAAGRPFTRLEGLDLTVAGQIVARREDLEVRSEDGWLVVDVPARILQPDSALQVQWVDAYR